MGEKGNSRAEEGGEENSPGGVEEEKEKKGAQEEEKGEGKILAAEREEGPEKIGQEKVENHQSTQRKGEHSWPLGEGNGFHFSRISWISPW